MESVWVGLRCKHIFLMSKYVTPPTPTTFLDLDCQRGAVCRPLLVTDSQPEGVAPLPQACGGGHLLVTSIQHQSGGAAGRDTGVRVCVCVLVSIITNTLLVLISPEHLPLVTDNGVIISASSAVEGQAANRENQLPVRTHDGHRATV